MEFDVLAAHVKYHQHNEWNLIASKRRIAFFLFIVTNRLCDFVNYCHIFLY